MFAELLNDLSSNLATGLTQAAGAIVLCLVVVLACRRFAVHVEREAAVSIARGLVQMVLVGVVLALLLHGSLLVGILILLVMTAAAAVTAARRARDIDGATLLSFYAIVAGSGVVIAGMLAIGYAANQRCDTCARRQHDHCQCHECLRAGCRTLPGRCHRARWPSGGRLALGADPAVTVGPYVKSAVYASLLPRLDMLKSLGLVWIPGVMAGMMVSGANPVYAGIYQFIIVAMILTASGIAGLVMTLLMRARAFSPAAQLTLRPPQRAE